MLRSVILGAAVGLCCMDMAFANPRVDFVYRIDSNKHMLHESRAFLPIVHNKNSLLFGDIRGVADFGTSTEFNLGLGSRYYIQKLDAIIGGYHFYDRRYQVELFEQSTIGTEILGNYFEARANLYILFSNKYSNMSTSIDGMKPKIHQSIKTGKKVKMVK